MKNKKWIAWVAGIGCLVLGIVVLAGVVVSVFLPIQLSRESEMAPSPVQRVEGTQEAIPTLTPLTPAPQLSAGAVTSTLDSFTAFYERVNPGVVNIQVYVEQGGITGQGAGSGFVLDEEGHIVTNNHVVAQAERVTVVFYNDFEAKAEIVGTDDDSDLAIIQVAELPEDVYPLPLGDSDETEAGEWVLAIGSPFGLGSSMTLGIVSAIGRSIPSGATPFAIPQAIQTDAAINPGNSGGPLLNLQGEVVGVNAQIASGGTPANAGVGFAIPSNVVRRVAPVLIARGAYQWPWLGVEGTSVGIIIMEANDLQTQQGAYIDRVEPGGPADEAGLEGSSGTATVEGLEVPVGGDVIVAFDGDPVIDWSDLLVDVAFSNPDDTVTLTVLRDGERQEFTVELRARPEDFGATP
jgi:2-alkenal reductase